MPAYNAAGYLSEAVRSVLAQDYESFELLVIDDGSTDDTPEILDQWSRRDPRVRVIRVKDNGGITRALNHGVEAARGLYVARQQVEAIENSPDVVLVSAGFDLINRGGRRIGRVMRLNPPEVTAYLLNFSNAVGGHGQVMFRRSDVLEAGGYFEVWELAEDYELWCRLSERGRIVTLPMIAMRQRQHSARLSVTKAEHQLRQTLAVMQYRLSKLLGRPLSDEETWSTGIIWRGLPKYANARTAEAILREAYRRSDQGGADPEHLRRVRLTTAWRWAVSALRLARCGKLAAAAHHASRSHAWHWSGLASGMLIRIENKLAQIQWARKGRAGEAFFSGPLSRIGQG
jgi:glycosyltransferase involved in cell wall biosynthesis